jgi:hypothetical protein
MNGSQPRMNGHCSLGFSTVRWVLPSWFILFTFVHSPFAHAQNTASGATAPAACPIEFVHFDPSGVSVRIRNVSGKKMVGLILMPHLQMRRSIGNGTTGILTIIVRYVSSVGIRSSKRARPRLSLGIAQTSTSNTEEVALLC